MYSKWQLAGKYLNYYLTASNGRGHGTHSPFIFHFITRVLNDQQQYPEYIAVENLRNQLLKDKTGLTIQDLGAGSSVTKINHRTIASIAKNSAKRKKFGQLLFRMVKAYQPRTILELGTSLGITTSYLALANTGAKVVTMEGAVEVAAAARKNFETLGIGNIIIEQGNFDATLSPVVRSLDQDGGSSVDFAFIDGNHRLEPTERYFRDLLPAINNDSIMIFDDIHWSREMEQAWETIKSHPATRCSIDLFFIGIIFFRQEFREKQHFSIRF
jgi:predicted O-methyltransferase YrrM